MRAAIMLFSLLMLSACGSQKPCPQGPVTTAQEGPASAQKLLLDKVAAGVDAVMLAGTAQPIVVFDLDATLFDNRQRTLKILQSWATQPERLGTPVSAQVLSLKVEQMEYLFTDSLAKVGVIEPAIIESIADFWKARFFTEWAVHDQAMPGGIAYVQSLYKAGAFIVYLTGRSSPRLLTATSQSLQISGYPIGLLRTQLIMKPVAGADDEVFKKTVMESLRRTGQVVAMFDNEPGNVNLMKVAFPDAQVIFLQTMFNPKNTSVVSPGIPSIIDFRR